MTWSTDTPFDGPISKDDLRNLWEPGFGDHAPEEMRQQFQAAVRALCDLASAVGRADDYVSVRMMGHANPNHAPADGWGDETIMVVLTAVPNPKASGLESVEGDALLDAHNTAREE